MTISNPIANPIANLAKALATAQGAMRAAARDSANPFFKSKYADLASVVEALRMPFSNNGLSYLQRVEESDKEEVRVETILLHESGEMISLGTLVLPVTKADAQGFGSALTYARRYSLSLLGVAPDDDDGNAAVAATAAAARATPKTIEPPKRKSQAEPPPAPTAAPNEIPISPVVAYREDLTSGTINEHQRRRLFAIMREQGWSPERLKGYLRDNYGISSSTKITTAIYEGVADVMMNNPVAAAPGAPIEPEIANQW